MVGSKLYQWYRARRLRGLCSKKGPDETLTRVVAQLRGASGEVLEIGAGTGSLIEHFSRDVAYTALEPNPQLRPDIFEAGRRAEIRSCEFVLGTAEKLPFPDASFDVVVEIRTLCSVADPAQALREIKRVLRVGGLFVFADHVAAPKGSLKRFLQVISRPMVRIISGGCNPALEVEPFIRDAGFSEVKIEHFLNSNGRYLLSPRIIGFCRK